MHKFFLISLIAFFSLSTLIAQTKPPANPVPYGDDEFPQWMEDLRRAEIITIGSFPLTLYASHMGFSVYRLALHDFNGNYSFDFLGNSPTPLTPEERLSVLGTALGLSLTMALADYIITKITDSAKQEK